MVYRIPPTKFIIIIVIINYYTYIYTIIYIYIIHMNIIYSRYSSMSLNPMNCFSMFFPRCKVSPSSWFSCIHTPCTSTTPPARPSSNSYTWLEIPIEKRWIFNGKTPVKHTEQDWKKAIESGDLPIKAGIESVFYLVNIYIYIYPCTAKEWRCSVTITQKDVTENFPAINLHLYYLLSFQDPRVKL